MSWLLSIFVALCGAVLGGLGAGLVAHAFVQWFRVSSFEGASGYYVVGIALLGCVLGFLTGLVCARVVAAGVSPGVLRAIGITLGVESGILLLALGLGWLQADFPPRIDGHELKLEVEISLPASMTLPDPKSDERYRWNATVTSPAHGQKTLHGLLNLNEPRLAEGKKTLPASISLGSQDANRILGIHCADHGPQYFKLSHPALPTRADLEWSPWLNAPKDAHGKPVAPEKAVSVRYRIQLETIEP